MKVTCPSCSTAYAVPDDQLGAGPRRVRCSTCDHVWRIGTPSLSVVPPEPEAPALADAPVSGVTAVAARMSADRAAQMAELREMIEDVKTPASLPAGRAEPGVVPGAGPGPAAALPGVGDDDSVRKLRDRHERRTAALSGVDDGASVRPINEPRPDPTPRPERNQGERSGSGWFMTGFMLIVILAMLMLAIYLLRGPIAEQFPQTVPILEEFVRRVDLLRAMLAETVHEVRAWLMAQSQGAGG